MTTETAPAAEGPAAAIPRTYDASPATEPGAVDLSYGFIGEYRVIVVTLPPGEDISLSLRASNLKSAVEFDTRHEGWGYRLKVDDQLILGSDTTTNHGERITRGYAFGKTVDAWLDSVALQRTLARTKTDG